MAEMNEEQMAELQEKLKNMSPEELKEFQKKQCIFCHIIAGKVQSKKVYEDDKCIGVLDINPANPGHILILPKEHYSIMPQLPEDELQHLFTIAKSLSNIALRALGVDGTNIIVANGVAAGQKAQHFMIHVIPRKQGDGIDFKLPQKKIEESELNDIARKLSKKLTELTGVKLKDQPPVVEAEFEEKPKEKQPKKEEPEEETQEDIEEVPEQEIEEEPAEEEVEQEDDKPEEEVEEEPEDNDTEEIEEKKPDLDDISKLLGAK